MLDVLLAAGLTWAAHSSVAIVLLIVSLASRGVVPPNAAFALVLGANLGTAINPLVEGVSGNDPSGKRLPFGNLLTPACRVAIGLILLDPVGALLVTVEPNSARAVADFHTVFNLAIAALVFPVLGPFARLLKLWLPARADPADPSASALPRPVSARDADDRHWRGGARGRCGSSTC